MSDNFSASPRVMVVEDRAARLAEELRQAHPGLASHLGDAASASLGLCDAHVPMLREALGRVGQVAPELAANAHKILAALDDLPGAIGRRGTVWIGRDRKTGLHSAHWEEAAHWLELGPEDAALEEVILWAHRRADDVRGPFDPDAE